MQQILHILDVIDIGTFQKIQDDIAEATGIAIITVDYKGKPVTRHSECTGFCKIVRSNSKLEELCEKCDSRGGLEAARIGRPYIYRCHRGLIDFAVPIIVQGQYLGALMAGQVLTESSHLLSLENIVQASPRVEDEGKLVDIYKDISDIPFKKIQSIAMMMFHIVNYIVGEGALKAARAELNEKNIKIIEARKAQLELEKELKASQLKALESQVNPHFLFNALNSISSLALVEKAPKTREVICDLSDMLSYTLRNANQIVTLEDEINYAASYLKLQKIRFRERLEYYIDIDEKYRGLKIPFMIIQPFIENSVIHGLELTEKGGYIKITAYEAGSKLIISILDNGAGISKEKLEILNNELIENKVDEASAAGIKNAKQRMMYYYGNNYSIDITSVEGKGTEVNIKISAKL